MQSSWILTLHITAAIIGLFSGFTALFVRKGARLHRRSGNVFLVSMLIMSSSAVALALAKSQMINVVVGALTFYMVLTAWLTVRRETIVNRVRIDVGAMVFAWMVGIGAVALGFGAANSATGSDKDGIPSAAYFVFGAFGLLAGGLDVRMLIRGGVSGVHRIARHLWRMCFALLITSVSFFNGTRSRMLPELIRKTPIHDIPALLVVVLLIFWLYRVLRTKAYGKSRYTQA